MINLLISIILIIIILYMIYSIIILNNEEFKIEKKHLEKIDNYLYLAKLSSYVTNINNYKLKKLYDNSAKIRTSGFLTNLNINKNLR
jgi:hypothetical protein